MMDMARKRDLGLKMLLKVKGSDFLVLETNKEKRRWKEKAER